MKKILLSKFKPFIFSNQVLAFLIDRLVEWVFLTSCWTLLRVTILFVVRGFIRGIFIFMFLGGKILFFSIETLFTDIVFYLMNGWRIICFCWTVLVEFEWGCLFKIKDPFSFSFKLWIFYYVLFFVFSCLPI